MAFLVVANPFVLGLRLPRAPLVIGIRGGHNKTVCLQERFHQLVLVCGSLSKFKFARAVVQAGTELLEGAVGVEAAATVVEGPGQEGEVASDGVHPSHRLAEVGRRDRRGRLAGVLEQGRGGGRAGVRPGPSGGDTPGPRLRGALGRAVERGEGAGGRGTEGGSRSCWNASRGGGGTSPTGPMRGAGCSASCSGRSCWCWSQRAPVSSKTHPVPRSGGSRR